jgi:hypothetical protein
MDNQFLLHLDTFIHYIYSKKESFSTFSRSVFGTFKTNYVQTVQFFDSFANLDCNISNTSFNIFDVFINMFKTYIEFKKNEVYFSKDVLYIRITELSQLFISSSNINIVGVVLQPEQKANITTLLTSLNNILSINHNKFISSTNQPNGNTASFRHKKLEDINAANFIDFNASKDFLNRLINKKLRYTNHINIISTHQSNQTTPSSLFFNKFPKPFLNDDIAFVEDYNKLVREFQTKSLSLISNSLNARVSLIDTKLIEIKSNLIEKGLDETLCNNNFSKLETDNNTSLANQFQRANDKVLRCSNKPFVAGQLQKQNKRFNNNNNNNSSHNNSINNINNTFGSNTSSNISNISSRSVKINTENNRYSTYNQNSPISSRTSSNYNNHNYRNNNNNNNNNNYRNNNNNRSSNSNHHHHTNNNRNNSSINNFNPYN